MTSSKHCLLQSGVARKLICDVGVTATPKLRIRVIMRARASLPNLVMSGILWFITPAPPCYSNCANAFEICII